MHEQDRSLGKAIHERRIELGLTQEALAERIGDGVRQSDVSRLERNLIQLPRPQRLRASARALDMEAGELLSAAGWEGLAQEAVAEPAWEPEGSRQSEPDIEPEASARSLPDTRSFDRLTQALENSLQIREESARSLDRAKETARSWRRHYGAGGSASERPDRPESIDP